MLTDAERDEIAKALRRGAPAAEVARTLIFPLNDVLTVQQELAGDRPAPNRTHALQPPVPMVVRPCPPDPDFTPAAVPAPRESTTVTETTTRPSWAFPQIAQLLDKASAIVVQGDAPRIEAARHAVYGALDVLRDVVDRHARTSGARERLAELEAEAARLRELLEGDGDDSPAPVAESPAATPASISVRPAVDSATIRAWAREAGVDVPPKGPLGARWVDAYWAAQGPQAAAS